MLDVVIVGAGGFARELAAMLGEGLPADQYRLKGFLGRAADTPDTPTASPLLGDPAAYTPSATDRFLLAIGHMTARRRLVERLESAGAQFISFIHPRAYIAPTAEIGIGAVIYPWATLSHGVRLEPHVHLNYYASVGHDCRVGPYCLLAPYATLNGFVVLEEEVYLSTHATVVPGRRVGSRAKVSANSAVMRDAGPDSFTFGVPGRTVRNLGPG